MAKFCKEAEQVKKKGLLSETVELSALLDLKKNTIQTKTTNKNPPNPNFALKSFFVVQPKKQERFRGGTNITTKQNVLQLPQKEQS